jgi:hypothetical protein
MWTMALLVAAAAGQDARELGALRARLRRLSPGQRGMGLIEGVVARGDGADGALATHTIEQVGRALDSDPPAIAFRDRVHVSRVHGGVVRVGEVELRVTAGDVGAAVWTSRDAKESAADLAYRGAFERAYDEGRRASGCARTVATSLCTGARVFVAGEIAAEGNATVVRAATDIELLVAGEDPQRFVTGRLREVVLFVVLEIAACAACTRLATWPPAFGGVSMVGAALCLAFFLGVTPIAVQLRDRCRPPSRAFLHGEWRATKRRDVR